MVRHGFCTESRFACLPVFSYVKIFVRRKVTSKIYVTLRTGARQRSLLLLALISSLIGLRIHDGKGLVVISALRRSNLSPIAKDSLFDFDFSL